jgi:hypothetical protein
MEFAIGKLRDGAQPGSLSGAEFHDHALDPKIVRPPRNRSRLWRLRRWEDQVIAHLIDGVLQIDTRSTFPLRAITQIFLLLSARCKQGDAAPQLT